MPFFYKFLASQEIYLIRYQRILMRAYLLKKYYLINERNTAYNTVFVLIC